MKKTRVWFYLKSKEFYDNWNLLQTVKQKNKQQDVDYIDREVDYIDREVIYFKNHKTGSKERILVTLSQSTWI